MDNLLELFTQSVFWKNKNEFLEGGGGRLITDAYLIFCLVKHRKINSYCEIGVRHGATLSLVLDARPTCECLVIDPRPRLNFLASKMDISKVEVGESKSQEYSIQQNNFDFSLIDGDHSAPIPQLDIIKMMDHCHNDSIIWLDDVNLQSGMDAQRELGKQGWRLWIKGSNGEIWAKDLNLQPFIDHMLSDESFKKFCVLYRETISTGQDILVINMPGGFLLKMDWINEVITDELKSR